MSGRHRRSLAIDVNDKRLGQHQPRESSFGGLQSLIHTMKSTSLADMQLDVMNQTLTLGQGVPSNHECTEAEPLV